MTRKKLFEDIIQNPTRIYRSPGDVLRDRRFGDVERLEILRAWRALNPDAGEMGDINALIIDLEGRTYTATDHAAE